MTPRLKIHRTKGSYSDRWIESCEDQKIPYCVVNCLDTDIMRQLAPGDGLLWHWHHHDPREHRVARQIILAAESMGVVVFPSAATCWHFDDKLAQKYLLEAVGAPLVPTYVCYDEAGARAWIETASFPKVFKLSKGAGSANVRLVRNSREALVLVRQAFGAGFPPMAGYTRDVRKRYDAARKRGDLMGAVLRLPRTLAAIRRTNRGLGNEGGYVYFQDFIAGNTYDTRVTVIGNRAFAFTRNVRPGDFRASGSGRIVYDLERIRPECVQIAFKVARSVGSQSMAFDFVLVDQTTPQVVEVSYSYDPTAVYRCAGHWNERLEWQAGSMWPQDAILLDELDEMNQRRPEAG